MSIVTTPITPDLLAMFDAAYTSSTTSAAVDAYCAGVPVVTVLDPTTLNLSPLRGCEGVSFISTPDELALALGSIISAPYKLPTKNYYLSTNCKLPLWQSLFFDAGLISKLPNGNV